MSQNNQKMYVNVHIGINEELFEIAYAYLGNYEISGIEEKLDEIVVCFPFSKWNDEIRVEILDILHSYDENIRIIKEESIEEKNWNEEWEKNLSPIIVSPKLAIVPSWKKDEIQSELKIIIDPKMSFGTGHHATTRLVCKLMEPLVKQDSFWIDAGTGTGVLAILAVMLGARQVMAFDNNIWSIENAIENIEINNCKNQIDISEQDINVIELPESDGIAANLYTHLLIPSLPKFYKSLIKANGDLVISGVLVYDEKDIMKNAEKCGFRHITTLYEDEWISAHFRAI